MRDGSGFNLGDRMPNPLLVIAPETEELSKAVPHKVGDLVVLSWGNTKTVKNRVCQITRVYTKSVGRGSYKYTYYNYDVRWLNGVVEKERSQDTFLSFEQYREKINRNIQTTNKILSRQYKDLERSQKLEAEAKKLFKVGV